ncbi:hypothetical protein J5N97_024906 [Dioscorea zingiberensis]|uniref:Glutaredoxin domain-containing protein n=1 Tax=Dioscorea zingiberensis TaxID=325984 RepID=A0A9D5C7S4_9LILI|nr:hypothetical protein J5N97_024906 [Dioscorea zingiberensis]
MKASLWRSAAARLSACLLRACAAFLCLSPRRWPRTSPRPARMDAHPCSLLSGYLHSSEKNSEALLCEFFLITPTKSAISNQGNCTHVGNTPEKSYQPFCVSHLLMHPYIEEKEEIILDSEEMMEMEMEMRSSWNERVRRMASGNAVVVFSLSGCCMCHVVKTLLHGLGVDPTVYELDLLENGGEEIKAVLFHLLLTTPNSSSSAAGGAALPVVFVGGKLLRGLEKVISCHINGSLVPLLKQAGAL